MEEKTSRRKEEEDDPGPKTKAGILLLGKAMLCCGDPTGNRRNPTGFPHSLAVPKGRTSPAETKALGKNAAAPQTLVPSLHPAQSSSLQKHHPTPTAPRGLEPAFFFGFFFLIIFKMTKLSLAENKEGKIVFQGNRKGPRRRKRW